MVSNNYVLCIFLPLTYCMLHMASAGHCCIPSSFFYMDRLLTCFLLPLCVHDRLFRGVYRSSPHAWQHPEAIVPPGSSVDEASGAMRSSMQPLSPSSRALTLTIPNILAPLTLAFVISLGPEPQKSVGGGKKAKFVTPLTGRHFSVLIGMLPGYAAPLGPSLIGSDAGAFRSSSKRKKGSSGSEVPATVNFAVRCRGGGSVSLLLLSPPMPGSNEWSSTEFALDPQLNKTGDTWHVAVPALHDLDRLRYGWRVDGDVSWESGFRVQPDQILLDPMAPALGLLPPDSAPAASLPRITLRDGASALVASGLGDLRRVFIERDGVSPPLHRPLEEMRVLEIDVATFARGPKVAEARQGTFLGVVDRIDHIKAVGANALVLAPCYASAKGEEQLAQACPDFSFLSMSLYKLCAINSCPLNRFFNLFIFIFPSLLSVSAEFVQAPAPHTLLPPFPCWPPTRLSLPTH